MVNKHYVQIWETGSLHNMFQYVTVQPRENMFHAVTSNTMYCPFLFAGKVVNRNTYLGFLKFWLTAQMSEKKPDT
jgi:hypothetical protein